MFLEVIQADAFLNRTALKFIFAETDAIETGKDPCIGVVKQELIYNRKGKRLGKEYMGQGKIL